MGIFESERITDDDEIENVALKEHDWHMARGGNGLTVISHSRRRKRVEENGQLQYTHGQMLGGRN